MTTKAEAPDDSVLFRDYCLYCAEVPERVGTMTPDDCATCGHDRTVHTRRPDGNHDCSLSFCTCVRFEPLRTPTEDRALERTLDAWQVTDEERADPEFRERARRSLMHAILLFGETGREFSERVIETLRSYGRSAP